MNLFAELKRRNVLRAAVLYAGTVWLLVQVIAQLGPLFHAPEWIARWFVIAAAIGFPFWIAFAWFYEFTPAGLKRESEIAPGDSIARSTGRKLDKWIIAVLAIAVVLLVTNQFVLRRDATSLAAGAGAKKIDEALANVPAKSIAVLPFENLSTEKANAFFADGIQDEILTGLARIGDLKVISRTSTAMYASHPGNLPQIAAKLGVATILEGSVQKAGNEVLINVQLIDARTDNHLWAQSYRRRLDDIFSVEGEVSKSIAVSLQAAITRDDRTALDIKPTDNADAYAAYLKGRALLSRNTFEQAVVEQRIAAFQQAVTLDPHFALAWADLVRVEVWMYWEGFDPTPARLATAKAALDHALALAPGVPQVELAQAWYLYYGKQDFHAALKAFRAAQKGLPNDETAWAGAGYVERRLGEYDAAVADFRHALTLSPNNGTLSINLGQTLAAQRRFSEASAAITSGLALKPGDPYLVQLKLFVLRSAGNMDAADRVLTAQHAGNDVVLAERATQDLLQRDFKAASSGYEGAVAVAGDFTTPSSFGGYIPAAVDWRLQWALSEDRRGARDHARMIYRDVKMRMLAALARKPANIHVEVALELALGEALAGLGERDAAATEGREATALIPVTEDAWEGSRWLQYLARIYAINGNGDDAVPLIASLLGTASTKPLTASFLRMDPVWDPIRNDPRFREVLQKLTTDEPAVIPPARAMSSGNTHA